MKISDSIKFNTESENDIAREIDLEDSQDDIIKKFKDGDHSMHEVGNVLKSFFNRNHRTS